MEKALGPRYPFIAKRLGAIEGGPLNVKSNILKLFVITGLDTIFDIEKGSDINE